MSAERERVETFGRLEDGLREAGEWYLWGPYLSERQWGTVREDYSPDGTAWEYLPHDHARSRAYRWGEDGLAGFSDVEQRLCIALALWNGRDPIVKERIFGLTGNEGNHGEDAKEYWWYLDALPSHAWNRWRYHYPQRAFPYAELVAENRRRGKLEPEFELLDTGVFDDDRYWIVEVDYAKGDPHDLLMTIRVTNAGPDADTVHVLPTAWYRNTWAWEPGSEKPELRVGGPARVFTEHPFLGPLELVADGEPKVLFCDNETNSKRLFGGDSASPAPKDGINDHVVSGGDTVADAVGTKAAFWYQIRVEPGETATVRVRLRPAVRGGDPWADFDAVAAARLDEADQFYAELTPATASEDEALVLRQALAGMLWSKQLYYYEVARWLDGDPTQPTPPASRLGGRNARWRTFDAFDIMSMPDKWEYPWFAAWDLAFHCIALARVDPAFAKYQLILLCREWFQHPNGALAAYEWSFDDVNPPVQAWAALEVFAIDGGRDVAFLSRIFDKLLVNFTWWVNREDRDGSNVFEGGFLGLDNIGPIDRSHLPQGELLEQSDGTGWMGFYALTMAAAATILNHRGRPATDLVLKFLEHFALISDAFESQDLWDEADGFFYDQLRLPEGRSIPVRVRSIVGILPLLGVAAIDETAVDRAETVNKRAAQLLAHAHPAGGGSDTRRMLLGVVGVTRVLRLLERLFDESEFLSPYGLRAVSRRHAEHPFELDVDGMASRIDYEPAESTTGMFGGNSNWRGPIWMPVNFLVVEALGRYARFFGDDLKIEYPTGSGQELTLDAVAADLRERLISLFLVGADGRRPCFGWVERLQQDPAWKDNLLFNEYFHGDNGAGLGASHQTGWTGLVAELILRGRGVTVPVLSELLAPGGAEARAS
jgi:Mannosylglycerate hydrolase MGH1-like glycoside hydrolase domain